MAKKGKYKLFSYLIENQLIYYKSLSKKDKILAFAILDKINFNTLGSILNDILRKRVIQYYSFQIDTNERSKDMLLLNFKDTKKEWIMKALNIVQQKMIENHIPFKFLKEKILEKRFLSLIFEEINSSTFITKTSESLSISTEKETKMFNIYQLNLELIKKKSSFIFNFTNLIKNLGRKGYLIFHFKIDPNENIKMTSYFIEKCDTHKNFSNIDRIVNNFFQCDLIKRQDLKIKAIFNVLWRLEINSTSFFLNDFYDLFDTDKFFNSLELSEINKLFKQNLLKNRIEYISLSKNLLFIEQSYLFLILQDLDSNYIHRIIEKYYPKYSIYIFILNYLGYEKLLNMKSIKLIESIKIINPLEIKNFNYKEFKIKHN